MLIHKDFIGGNILVKETDGNTVVLENELRDTMENWFYWAFCVEDAENETITFKFQQNRLGYFGPAVSYDLVNWHWLDGKDGDSFTYHFNENESKVYFAHSMLYHPDRFLSFAERHGLYAEELCRGYKGSSVPCVKLGEGKRSIILTARHHACESTGNYVLEGVLEELVASPIPDTRILCVPFVDYDGVIRGDQGKRRAPHDHNRDYSTEVESIYPECNKIIEYAEKYGCHYAFDFHSPWHTGGDNDNVFIVQKSKEKLDKLNRFGEIFESFITDDSLKYEHKNDYPPETGWNKSTNNFGAYMNKRPENEIALTLETTYFGTSENKVSEDGMIKLGHAFAKAIKKYIEDCEK